MADGFPLGAKRTTRYRDIDIVKMERDLMIWLDECNTKDIPVSGNLIKQKALQIYNHYREISDPTMKNKRVSFNASKGWLENLKKRYSLRKIKVQGDQTVYKFNFKPERLESHEESTNPHMDNTSSEKLNSSLNNRSLLSIIIKNENIDEPKTDVVDSNNSTKSSWISPSVCGESLHDFLEIIHEKTSSTETDNINSYLTREGFEDRNQQNLEERFEEGATDVEERFQEGVTDVEERFQEETINEEELIKLIDKSTSNVLANDNTIIEERVENFDSSVVESGLKLGKELEIYFTRKDPSIERRGKFIKDLKKCLAPYKKLLSELKAKTAFENTNKNTRNYQELYKYQELRKKLESNIESQSYFREVMENQMMLLRQSILNNNKSFLTNEKTIYAITPTFTRAVQKAELTRLSQTFQLVPNFHWIVVEDSSEKTKLVRKFLEESSLIYTHLAVATPPNYKLGKNDPNWKKPRGVEQRNAGLRWLRKNLKPTDDGVVFFADDDNTYSVKLFQEMRKIQKVGVWPVGLVGGLMVEKPICDNATNKVVGFNAAWKPNRPFPIDMAGFAINLKLLLGNKDALFSYDVESGYQESEILRQIVIKDELEPLADSCTKVYVWHTRTEPPRLSVEQLLIKKGKRSDIGTEV
ncbi:hypothetical protein M0802_009335 [Mischocyttarus mexicanus]|nr:hypothetical protein M0802_009335 [Mischocyttarus mexicanus]